MTYKHLSLAYNCLDAIGNTLDIYSMIFEILCTFSRKTNAIYGGYYSNHSYFEPMVQLGTNVDFRFDINKIKEQSYIIEIYKDMHIIIVPLRYGYLEFVYKNIDEYFNEYAVLFGSFQNKINLSIASCHGVEELEVLNQDLEASVENSVSKIREHEKMLMIKAKHAIMGEMLEIIAHQWRQPITAIGMISNSILLDLVLDELDTDDLQVQLNDINKQVSYLSDTIDDFGNFFKESKIKENIVVSDLIDIVVNLVKKQFEKSQIRITVEDICKEAKIYIYRNELIQVFLSILNNSREAFNEILDVTVDKRLSIGCSIDAKNIQITICDNAGGINKEIISKIFEPYFSTKNDKNGSGIGLYMSKTIVNEHLGGEIYAQNIDEGAMFKIVLPLVNEDN